MRQGRPVALARWAAVAAIALCACIGSARADVLAGLIGGWGPSAGQPATMQWSKTDDGFALAWTPMDDGPTTVQFSPAKRPGVYTGRSRRGWSMIGSMFGDSTPSDPLAGDTLYWARATADAMFVYRMAVDDKGGFRIDRYRCRPDGSALIVAWDRRTAAGAEGPREEHLVRIGR